MGFQVAGVDSSGVMGELCETKLKLGCVKWCAMTWQLIIMSIYALDQRINKLMNVEMLPLFLASDMYISLRYFYIRCIDDDSEFSVNFLAWHDKGLITLFYYSKKSSPPL